MRIIALEEHFATPGLMEGPGAWLASYPQWMDPLLDIGDGRVAAMDAAGIDTAVLSLTAPGVEQLEGPEAVKLARETFANLLAQVGIDRIMFSADYPFGSMAEGREFLDALPIGQYDREKIAHKSAEKLLRM